MSHWCVVGGGVGATVSRWCVVVGGGGNGESLVCGGGGGGGTVSHWCVVVNGLVARSIQ